MRIAVLLLCLGAFGLGIALMWTRTPSPPPPTTPAYTVDEITQLIAAIDFDNKSNDHGEVTPAVCRLQEIGEPVLPYLLPVLLDSDSHRRGCAGYVLTKISMEWFKAEPGTYGLSDQAFKRWRAFWESLGDYDHNMPAAQREKSVRLWYAWLRKNGKLPPDAVPPTSPTAR